VSRRKRCAPRWRYAYSPVLGEATDCGESSPLIRVFEFPVFQGGWNIGTLRIHLAAKLNGAVVVDSEFERAEAS
jgi:hypothetical protein